MKMNRHCVVGLVMGYTALLLISGSATANEPTPSQPRATRVSQKSKHPHDKPLTLDLGEGVSMVLVWIPEGEFVMGRPEHESGPSAAKYRHRVRISKGFWMGKYEVTQEQWERVMGYNPAGFEGTNLPVENVSWAECQDFVIEINNRPEIGDLTASLPTEAEWEYACRARTSTPFHYGASLDSSMANFDGNHPYGNGAKGVRRGKTTEVGSFGPRRIVRGGSWINWGVSCRSASRNGFGPGVTGKNLGLRIIVR